MWKSIKYSCGLIFMILLTISKGWSQSARQSSTLASPEASLTAPSVSPVSTEAWSKRAIEKVEEWIAYLNLLREAENDSLISSQLKEFSAAYFLNDDAQLVFGDVMIPLQDWLTRQSEYIGGEISVSEMSWKDEWMLIDEQWVRELGLKVSTPGAESLGWQGTRSLTVILSRVEKSFGEDKLTTWEVRFNELK